MRRLFAALVAVLLLAAAGASRADDTRRAGGPLLPAVVRGGETVELDWHLEDPEVEELELELSVDGGPWKRISPELPGLTRRFAWRVPEIRAERARVRVRVGTEHGEWDLPPSAEFRIETEAPEAVGPRAPGITGRAALPGSLAAAPPALSAAAQTAALDSPPRAPECVPPTPAVVHVASALARSPATATVVAGVAAPLRYPLRN